MRPEIYGSSACTCVIRSRNLRTWLARVALGSALELSMATREPYQTEAGWAATPTNGVLVEDASRDAYASSPSCGRGVNDGAASGCSHCVPPSIVRPTPTPDDDTPCGIAEASSGAVVSTSGGSVGGVGGPCLGAQHQRSLEAKLSFQRSSVMEAVFDLTRRKVRRGPKTKTTPAWPAV